MSSTDLAFLVSQYRAVEILDALTDHPLTFHDLHIEAHASRRPLAATLRMLAAHGLVRRTHPGSWDQHRPGRYELTPHGHALADRLSVLDVWVDLYEHHL
ncbi:winged helix-turn-helix transcriptional regulator [Kibdelosporangium lantanae]|uniref:Winged helix-turn-helix transcriptional regulator n=1 Tax=Kibdelosporangium lantanae TaxID=1497396 RepID=A0ABW3M9Y1_9PSEU